MYESLALRRWVVLLAAALLASCGGAETEPEPNPEPDPDPDPSECYELADGRCVMETYANPPTLVPNEDGVHRLELAPTEVDIGGERHCVRAYNGAIPGPTIETPAGSNRQVRVDIVNRFTDHDSKSLDGESCQCQDVISGMSCNPSHDPCNDETCVCVNPDTEEICHVFDFNVTNLHAHGSHIRPDYSRGEGCTEYTDENGTTMKCRKCSADACDSGAETSCFFADDVISTVHPGEGAQHRWDIDEDHRHHEGLHWYHPHIHGTTSIQVSGGAAGAWIVRGPLDDLEGIKDARERVMIFATPPVGGPGFSPLADGEPCNEENITFNDFKTLGAVQALQLNVINGIRRPRLVMAPGQIERWRLLHGGFLDEVFLGVFKGKDLDCKEWDVNQPVALTQIGRDGIITDQKWSPDYMFMSPGYRIEAILDGNDFEDGDTLCLASHRTLQQRDGPPGFLDEATGLLELPTPESIIADLAGGDLVAIVNVTSSAGAPTEDTPPDYDAVAALAPDTDLADECERVTAIEAPEDVDQIAMLQVGFLTTDDPLPCECPGYNVNCKNFELTDRDVYPVDRDLRLGKVDHWRIAASVDGHPFHIHINPFLVCPDDQPNPFDPPFPHWRDTYLVNLDRKIDLLAEYRKFTGAFVFHCHKLTHEDHGMMELIRVCDDSDETCGTYGWDKCSGGEDSCAKAIAATKCAMHPPSCLEAAELCLEPPQIAAPGEACGDGVECGPPGRCVDEICVLPLGAPCEEDEQCESGNCRDPLGPPDMEVCVP